MSAHESILLQTARLRLRAFSPGDLDRLVELDSDPEVMRYITYGVPTPRDVYERTILPRWLATHDADPRLGYFAAERHDGEFLGWFHLRPDRFDAGEQELGYRLARRHWGQGYATEGARALIEHGFRVAEAPKVSARALVGNRASQAVMRKCGLVYECAFVFPQDVLEDRDESERAAVKYSLSRRDWLTRRA
jgi:RimJ/RimL family protein N-acetyltransferase